MLDSVCEHGEGNPPKSKDGINNEDTVVHPGLVESHGISQANEPCSRLQERKVHEYVPRSWKLLAIESQFKRGSLIQLTTVYRTDRGEYNEHKECKT